VTAQRPRRGLRWIPGSIANILHDNGIDTREELANAAGLALSTVYKIFPADAEPQWSGWATDTTLYALAYTFNVPLSRLVYEPAAERVADRNARRAQKRARNSTRPDASTVEVVA
jgi:hypothetical protein